jgi:Peptidase family S41
MDQKVGVIRIKNFSSGVDTASLLLPDNDPVVYIVNKSRVADTQSTLAIGYDTTTPIFILVDNNTASAAEVLPQQYKRIIVQLLLVNKRLVNGLYKLYVNYPFEWWNCYHSSTIRNTTTS